MLSRIAFVTHAGRPDLAEDDRLAAAELARQGAAVEAAAWDDPRVDWSGFDRIVLRSCWDYHRRLPEFLGWLGGLERAGAPVWNPPAVVRGNADKGYLVNLAAAGVPVVPTVRVERGAEADLASLLDERGWTDAVVKPAVSASAFLTRRVRREEAAAAQADFDHLLTLSAALVQPFLPEIQSGGEWSLLFFTGEYSHALLKRPRAGDFRVQSELGGSALAQEPPPELVARARAVLDHIPGPWLYARVDGIEAGGTFLLMELELIEPSLFLDRDPEAPARFAAAVLRTP